MKHIKVLLLLLSIIIIHCSIVYAEHSADDLLKMTIEGLSYDTEADTASVLGVGKILQDDSLGLMRARRAAITDAQRGLLILRRSILEKKPPRPGSVSGSVPPFQVLSEDIRDGIYFVKIQAVLSELVEEEEQHKEEGKTQAETKNMLYKNYTRQETRRKYHDENRMGIFMPHNDSVSGN